MLNYYSFRLIKQLYLTHVILIINLNKLTKRSGTKRKIFCLHYFTIENLTIDLEVK